MHIYIHSSSVVIQNNKPAANGLMPLKFKSSQNKQDEDNSTSIEKVRFVTDTNKIYKKVEQVHSSQHLTSHATTLSHEKLYMRRKLVWFVI